LETCLLLRKKDEDELDKDSRPIADCPSREKTIEKLTHNTQTKTMNLLILYLLDLLLGSQHANRGKFLRPLLETIIYDALAGVLAK
jgi:hypothetical protein